MTLTGRVVQVESAATYRDKMQRVIVRVNEADEFMSNQLRLPNTEGWGLDDEIVMSVTVARIMALGGK